MHADGLKRYDLELSSSVSSTFRCVKAANSLDIDSAKKSVHRFSVDADIESDYAIGLIVGASGSGKTTLAHSIWGANCFAQLLKPELPVIEQLPAELSYEDCASMLIGVGLTSVPCWIRPAYTLSNGQRARAECALQMATKARAVTMLDEWTSVVDRTVAKVMSHCIAKHARKTAKRIVLLSCHYDVIEWLNPDWIIDCNRQEYIDRRSLCREFQRGERLHFDIAEVDGATWRFFSKYHYLSDELPVGVVRTFGLFHDGAQIGFQCFANYVPHRNKLLRMQMHSNRTVIHPDYVGLGMGIQLINRTSDFMLAQGFDVRAKYSSTPVYLAMRKYPEWELLSIDRKTVVPVGKKMIRRSGFRRDVKTYSFRYIGDRHAKAQSSA